MQSQDYLSEQYFKRENKKKYIILVSVDESLLFPKRAKALLPNEASAVACCAQ
jgi:hypothetical protein